MDAKRGEALVAARALGLQFEGYIYQNNRLSGNHPDDGRGGQGARKSLGAAGGESWDQVPWSPKGCEGFLNFKGIPQPCSMEVQPAFSLSLGFSAFRSFVRLCVLAAVRGHEAVPLLERFSCTGLVLQCHMRACSTLDASATCTTLSARPKAFARCWGLDSIHWGFKRHWRLYQAAPASNESDQQCQSSLKSVQP